VSEFKREVNISQTLISFNICEMFFFFEILSINLDDY
jgi:hypothetical protein